MVMSNVDVGITYLEPKRALGDIMTEEIKYQIEMLLPNNAYKSSSMKRGS